MPPTPPRPQEYPPPGYQPQGYQATEYVAPGGYQAPGAPYGQPAYGPGTPPYPAGPPPQRRGRGLLIALAVVIVLAAGGGAYALATTLGKHATAQPSTSPSAQASTSTQAASASGSPSSGSPGASASPSARPTPSASAPGLVAVGPGVSGSAVPKVQAVLSRRFQAINAHDYDAYAATLTPGARASQPRSTFDSGYATTQDSGITLTALASSGSGMAATVTFTSRQDPADSVDHSGCNTWTITLDLVPNGPGYLVDSSPSASHGDC